MGQLLKRRILAVASSGGHWVQLRRLSQAFEGHDVVYVTTHAGHRAEVDCAGFHVVPDANRWERWKLVRSVARLSWIVLRERPDVIVSTGAAPGYLALRLGRLVGARTAWIDSVANVDEMSLSGEMASKTADLCLTQWPHLTTERVGYEGSVL